ncbi:MAG TPA: CoA pyrophosphatase [Steroidobacteraceae bacterium]|nr:CoA pyrophosphatase [Steroidobacteraceae bacterium]
MSPSPHLSPVAERDLRALLRERLAGTVQGDPAEARIAGLTADAGRPLRHLLPEHPTPAAVLIPIVDHPDELTVLLTERAADLRHHPGQISFPGGRLEPGESDPVAAALRETEEEIGLNRRHVEVLGFLPDQLIITGYRVTPVVALVAPGTPFTLDPVEVAAVFEVPLRHVLDPANHRPRQRTLGGLFVTLYEIPCGTRTIWGATAGMLIGLAEVLTAGAGAAGSASRG